VRQAAFFAGLIKGQQRAGRRRCRMNTLHFINTVATGQNIDKLRISAGMSVRDMQTEFGFSTPQAIYKWIHGTTMPTVDNLVILAAMFEVTIDDIVVVDVVTKTRTW
jgi:hypothetical protein